MFTIVFDTICQGYCAITEDGNHVIYETYAEAQAEIDSDLEFYEDCFVVPTSMIGHKPIFTGQ